MNKAWEDMYGAYMNEGPPDDGHDYHAVSTGGGLQFVMLRVPRGETPAEETSWGDNKKPV